MGKCTDRYLNCNVATTKWEMSLRPLNGKYNVHYVDFCGIDTLLVCFFYAVIMSYRDDASLYQNQHPECMLIQVLLCHSQNHLLKKTLRGDL